MRDALKMLKREIDTLKSKHGKGEVQGLEKVYDLFQASLLKWRSLLKQF